MDKRDLFFSCKTGDLSRIQYLVEEKDVNLHVRDKWGGTPLYYACLCGHYEVVLYLLQNGVQCDANTFDGERCLYGALTDNIRHLLRNFKIISAITMRRDHYDEFLRRVFEVSDYSDVHFIVQNEKILAHRSILACRSTYFQNFFTNKSKDITQIDFTELNMSPFIFKSLMQYLYMGQMTINKKITKAFITVADYFNMASLVSEINRILSSRKKMSVLYVQPSPLPQQDFMKLFRASLPAELKNEGTTEETLFVDLHIKVDNYIFLCHKVFVCGRCTYLKALVTDHFAEASVFNDGEIQVITLHNIDPFVFIAALQYIYTDTSDLLPGNVYDVLCLADLFILPGLKKLCESVIQENLATDNIISVIKLVRLYSLPRLEDHCTEFMAEHLEEIIDLPDFVTLIIDDANEIHNREEIDTISIIDDIRYHIDKSEKVSNCFQKHALITKLLENLKLEA